MSSNPRILVVEDDFDISNMLNIFFKGQGYEVEVAPRGSEALEKCRQQLPDLIVLDIMLPDMNGFEVCRELRTTTRTKHIPIIFLTQRDERRDRIEGLELGADDYITKPFDIEELKLRVQNAIKTYRRNKMTNPQTRLPSGELIEEELKRLIQLDHEWHLVQINIDYFSEFTEAHGFVAGNEVLRFMAQLIQNSIEQVGTLDDFIGQTVTNDFIVTTRNKNIEEVLANLSKAFSIGVEAHYNFMEVEQGGIMAPDGKLIPLMSLSFGIVSYPQDVFSDIREVTELAAERKRIDQGKLYRELID
ncbi:MAG: response regulator [Chloroflexota bacterium]